MQPESRLINDLHIKVAKPKPGSLPLMWGELYICGSVRLLLAFSTGGPQQ